MEIVPIDHRCAPAAQQLLGRIGSGRRLGFDVETDSAAPTRGPVVTWQVADCDDVAFVVDARAWPLSEPAVAGWLANRRAEKAIHYSPFEAEVVASCGGVLRGAVDTCVLARLICAGALRGELGAAGLAGFSLSSLVRLVFGVELDKSLQLSFRSGKRLSAAQLHYAAADAHWALRLSNELDRQVRTAGLDWAGRLERSVALVAAAMSSTGVPVNAKRWWEICERAAGEAALRARSAAGALGMPKDLFGAYSGFSPASNAQVGAAFGRLGIDLGVRGRAEGSRQAMYDLSDSALHAVGHRAARDLLAYRQAKNLADWADAPDRGRIYPHWVSIGAATGRMASKRPNVMAIPTELSSAVAVEDGKALVAADYHAQEVYVLASLAQDSTLMGALRSGEDPYEVVAKHAGIDRKTAKRAFLATAYGSSAASIANSAGVSSADGAKIKRAVEQAFPRSMAYCASVRAVPAPDAGTGLLSGLPAVTEVRCLRRRRLAVTQRRGAFLRNTRVQASGADMIKVALVRACKELDGIGGRLVLAVHDELVAEVPATAAEAAREILVTSMKEGARIALESDLVPPVKAGAGDSLAAARDHAR